MPGEIREHSTVNRLNISHYDALMLIKQAEDFFSTTYYKPQ